MFLWAFLKISNIYSKFIFFSSKIIYVLLVYDYYYWICFEIEFTLLFELKLFEFDILLINDFFYSNFLNT